MLRRSGTLAVLFIVLFSVLERKAVWISICSVIVLAGKRLEIKGGEVAIANDRRTLVVYLRSFDEDVLLFPAIPFVSY